MRAFRYDQSVNITGSQSKYFRLIILRQHFYPTHSGVKPIGKLKALQGFDFSDLGFECSGRVYFPKSEEFCALVFEDVQGSLGENYLFLLDLFTRIQEILEIFLLFRKVLRLLNKFLLVLWANFMEIRDKFLENFLIFLDNLINLLFSRIVIIHCFERTNWHLCPQNVVHFVQKLSFFSLSRLFQHHSSQWEGELTLRLPYLAVGGTGAINRFGTLDATDD